MRKIGKLHAAWIWFWYNDMTRTFFVVIPTHYLIIVPVLLWSGMDVKSIGDILWPIYGLILAWAFIDNDYSNLRKIGLNEYRKKLNTVKMPKPE